MPGNWPVPFGKGPSEKDPNHGHLVGGLLHSEGGRAEKDQLKLAPRRAADPTRFIVKDRLDVTGARWSLAGAEAVLALRAMIANGDMDTYWPFHLQRDYERTHATRYQGQLDLAA